MHEWFAFGRDHYEMRREQMKLVCARANMPLGILEKSFEDRVTHWKEMYLPKST
jgi:hypothetical protein